MTTHIPNIPTASDQQNKGPGTDLYLEPDSNNSELTAESLATIPDSDFTNMEVDAHTRNTEFTLTASTSTSTLTYSQALTGQRTSQQAGRKHRILAIIPCSDDKNMEIHTYAKMLYPLQHLAQVLLHSLIAKL